VVIQQLLNIKHRQFYPWSCPWTQCIWFYCPYLLLNYQF